MNGPATHGALSEAIIDLVSSSPLDASTCTGILFGCTAEYAAGQMRHHDITREELLKLFGEALDRCLQRQLEQFGVPKQ